MTFKEKLVNCYKILFENKRVMTVTYGVKSCKECEYNLRCNECIYKALAKNTPIYCTDKKNKLVHCEDCHDKDCKV